MATTDTHAGHAHDAHHSPEAIRAMVKKYLVVGGMLYVLTIVTVAIAYLRMDPIPALILALVVATTKASLVALYFMHLIDEKKVIYWTLGMTVFFFGLCLIIPALTDGEGGAHRIVHEAPHGGGSKAHGDGHGDGHESSSGTHH